MRRAHRQWHRGLWPLLLVAVTLLFTLALAWRAPAPAASLQDNTATDNTPIDNAAIDNAGAGSAR